jgi:hypothetical protein
MLRLWNSHESQLDSYLVRADLLRADHSALTHPKNSGSSGVFTTHTCFIISAASLWLGLSFRGKAVGIGKL